MTEKEVALLSHVTTERCVIADIPALVAAPDGARGLPTVVFVPGFGSDKLLGMDLALGLAARGVICVSVDPAHHGDRDDGQVEAVFDTTRNVYPPESGLDVMFVYNRCIVETAYDIDRLIQALSSDVRVDTARVGIAGFSMGGTVTLLAAARNPGIQVAVAIGAMPSPHQQWEKMVDKCRQDPGLARDMAVHADEFAALSACLTACEPIAGLTAFAPKPLLIVNGDRDVVVPHRFSLQLVRQLEPLWADHPERLRLLLPPVEHCLTSGILKEATEWFERYL